ncbi:Smr/MutS family protein [Aquimarina brevivitae]|uniref:Smr domain-containing protein n=1 Tax=Aquimarina brevivitae TaxID=323412 RepID=A0A4Q7NVK8_9FLAO|nr:Smr/MutS family protein [Aquimarina brevivitae]RZS90442.1 hypothetical protein EV197_3427 [Aquimarina brevivitae]
MEWKIGDNVAVLDEPIAGKILAIDKDTITIESEDGFALKFMPQELVKVDQNIDLPTYDEVHEMLQQKEVFKKKPKKAVVTPKKKEIPAMEVDLHIHKLVKSTKGMTNYDMLTLQVDTATRQLDFAIHKRIPSVVFIHGVGQGVLKEELRYLFSRYDNVSVTDADYKKYGLGAMEVYIIQNPK